MDNNSSNYKNAAFSMELDSTAETVFSIGNSPLIFCSESIWQIETAIERDPLNEYPYAPNTKKKIINKGMNNAMVKSFAEYFNTFKQFRFKEFQAIVFNSNLNKNQDKVVSLLFELLKSLLVFEDKYKEIIDMYNAQFKKAHPIEDNNFEINVYINDLENMVNEIIIIQCGGILNKLINLIVLFYDDKLSNTQRSKIFKNDKRLDFMLNVFVEGKIFDEENPILKFIDFQNAEFLNKLIKIRNALEHPEDKRKVIIENFKLLPSRIFDVPKWQLMYKGEKEDPQELMKDLSFYCQNLVGFVYALINLLIIDAIDNYCACENGQIIFAKKLK